MATPLYAEPILLVEGDGWLTPIGQAFYALVEYRRRWYEATGDEAEPARQEYLAAADEVAIGAAVCSPAGDAFCAPAEAWAARALDGAVAS